MADFTLYTCSYSEYHPGMGMAIRITLGLPRTKIGLDGYLHELAPRGHYFRAHSSEFDEKYIAQLERYGVDHLTKAFEHLAEFGSGAPIVLLCFERQAVDGSVCHRRLFAEWWEKKTGQEVPELGWVPRERQPAPPTLPLEGIE